jgi:nucleoside-diphosphate-sugar epimerase
VDVRDVAFAHLQGLKVKEAANQRFILCSKSLWFKEVAAAINTQLPGYKIKTKELGFCPVKVASFVDPGVKQILPLWKKVSHIDNSRSQYVLGVQYIPAEDAVAEMARSLIENKIVRDKRK